MLPRIGAPLAVAGCLVVAACSGGASPATTTVAPTSTVRSTIAATSTTTTAVARTTVAPATTTTTTSTTTTSTTSTTTTVAPDPELSLRDDGLGEARFGADPDSVIEYVGSIIGAPTSDSGWVAAQGQFGSCLGNEVRGVGWRDLTLMFGDASDVTSGRRHFFAYVYGPPSGAAADPPGVRTAAGISVGSTVAALRGAYPNAVVRPGDQISPASFSIGDRLNGILTGVTAADTVQAVSGGTGCGE